MFFSSDSAQASDSAPQAPAGFGAASPPARVEPPAPSLQNPPPGNPGLPESAAKSATSEEPESRSAFSQLFGMWTDSKGADLSGADATNGFFSSKPEPKVIKVTDEQVKTATAVRENLDKKMTELAIDPKQQEAIKARTKGLSGEALVQEMSAVGRALSGPNAERALATYSDLSKLAESDPKAKERLTPEVIAMMVTGTGDRRTDSDRGQSGILGGKSARDAAQGLLSMSDDEYKQTMEVLQQAGTDKDGKEIPGADPHAEQSLILKAIAARKDEAAQGDKSWDDKLLSAIGLRESPAAKAGKDVSAFAKEIRGMGRSELIRTTSTIDIDGAKDDDGLKQRYSDSCVPTTAQMAKGEADPIYARKLNKDGLSNMDPNTDSAKEQRQELEDGKGTAVSRQGTEERTRAREGLRQLGKDQKLTPLQQANLARYLKGDKANAQDTEEDRQKALTELRQVNGGHPKDAEVAAIRDNGEKKGVGMDEGKGLNDVASSSTNVDYQRVVTNGNLDQNAKDIDAALKDGQAVPFSITSKSLANLKDSKKDADGNLLFKLVDPKSGKEEWYPADDLKDGPAGHAMMLSDVRTDKNGKKSYLMSDPWSGGTRWVSADDLKSGDFAKTGGAFPDLGGVDTKVDDIYLNKGQGKAP